MTDHAANFFPNSTSRGATMFDIFTGKPVDRLSDMLPTFNGAKCDECGHELIDRCGRCGAPICCPRCCEEFSDV